MAEPSKSKDVGQSQVSKAFDEAESKGFFGVSPDPTPRANYTVPGVLKGAPTPETDDQAKADALNPEKTR